MNNSLFSRIIKALILAAAVIWAAWATRYFSLYQYITPQGIREFVLSFGFWSPAVFIGAYIVRTFFLFSSTLLALTAGISFGPFWGTIYTVIGATISACLAFFLARFLGEDFLEWLLHRYTPAIEDLDEKISREGFWIILFLRVVPLVPYDIVNFGAGFSKIRFWPYFWSTLLGLIPSSIVFNFLGRSLLDLRDPRTQLTLALILIVLLTPSIYRIIKNRSSKNHEGQN
jgi:uncharacterized membrane protein YdjX (TVP38/TMEM64 family)